jgi:glycosyltransferase involved in cell wall biosynthesis
MPKVSGVIWIGRFYEHGGWGTIARNYVRGLHKIGFPVQAIPVGTIHPDLEYRLRSEFGVLRKTDAGKYPVVVLDKGTGFFKQVVTNNVVRRIGCALAETDRVLPSMVADCKDIDELWVPSHFSKETFLRSGVSANKIRVIPYSLETDAFIPRSTRYRISGSRGFVFLFVFGAGLRKGYNLLLEAYFNEFKSSDDVTLVLKVFSGDFRGMHKLDVQSKVLGSVADKVDVTRTNLPHVVFIDEILSHEQLLDLYSGCDLYISTDRANGWGFPCMEAMAMGKPAATINWSGSTEFMHKDNSFLIQPTGRLVPVDSALVAENPYYAGNLWAEVCVEEVQQVMRYAYEHPGELKQIAERGMKDIRKDYSLEAVARKIVAAVSEIPVGSRQQGGNPQIRFKNAYGLKFSFRLFYYRFRYWCSGLEKGRETKDTQ